MGQSTRRVILKQELENGYILKNHIIANLKSLGFSGGLVLPLFA